MSGNLIKDHTDLLVEYKNESILSLQNSNMTESVLSDSDLTDSTLNIFDLLSAPNRLSVDDDKLLKILIKMLVKSCRIFDVATNVNEDKISYWRYANPVIAVLKRNDKKSPILQVENSRQDIGTQTCDENSEDQFSTTQDSEFKTVIEAKKIQKDVFEEKEQDFANSIVELVSESLNLSTLHDEESENTQIREHIYENERNLFDLCEESVYVNYESLEEETSSLKLEEEEDINKKYKLEDTVKSSSDAYHDMDQDLDRNRDSQSGLYENINFFLQNKYDESTVGYLRNNTNNKSSFNRNRKHYLGRNLSFNRKNQILFNLSSNRNNRAQQDETLRDAENISDIENESDIDQWVDLNSNDNENKINNSNSNGNSSHTFREELIIIKNKKDNYKQTKTPQGYEKNSKYSSNFNELKQQQESKQQENNKRIDSDLGTELKKQGGGKIGHKNFLDNKTTKSKHLSSYILINSFEIKDRKNSNNKNTKKENFSNHQFDLENISYKNNNNNHCDIPVMHEYENSKSLTKILRKKFESNHSNFLQEKEIENNINFKNNNNSNSNINCNNIYLMNRMHGEPVEQQLDENNTRMRTHSLDSLEEEKEEFTVECQHYTIPIELSGMDKREEEIPEIKIDFEYQLINNNNENVASSKKPIEIKTTNSNYVVGDLKNTQKFNEEIVVKQRARESLKFWKSEEEKRKNEVDTSHNGNNSSSISSSSNTSTSLSLSSSNSTSKSNERRASVNMDSISSNSTSVEPSVIETFEPAISSRRVKDRISVFESKCQENNTGTTMNNVFKMKKGSKSNYDRISSVKSSPAYSIVEAKPVETKFSNSIQSRIESLEKNFDRNESVKTLERRGKSLDTNRIKEENGFTDTLTSTRNIDLSYSNDLDKPKPPEKLTISTSQQSLKSLSSKSMENGCESRTQIEPNQNTQKTTLQEQESIAESNTVLEIIQADFSHDDKKEQEIQIQIQNHEIHSSSVTLDKKKNISLSLTSLNSEPEQKEICILKNSHENLSKEIIIEQINQIKKSESHLSIITCEIDNKDQSTQNDIDRSQQSKDDSDIEEIEIVIDLNKFKNDKNEDSSLTESTEHQDSIRLNEVLKNIVMHLIPTTRKAYVDDIVDGIKSQMTYQELAKINSPLDLPKNVVRFIQKRYSSLLNENLAEKPTLEILPDEDEDSHRQECLQNQVPIYETTELTVVKEIRKEILSSSESEIRDGKSMEEDDIMKVDEETLYIVEKIRQVGNSSESVIRSTSFVDNEIRKNFELKPKQDEEEKISTSTPPGTLTKNRSKDFKKLIDDLRKSIANFNLYYPQLQAKGLVNEINDYQLHFFNVENCQQSKASILVILFDKQNEENMKFSLEQNYQKSIIETHLSLNKCVDINIVANLNLYYIDDIDSAEAEFGEPSTSYLNLVNNSKFYEFSLFKRMKETNSGHLNDASTNFLPVGKYFVKIQYKHVIYTNDLHLNTVINETRTEKESIVDLSLLPLAIRSQLIYECDFYLHKKSPQCLPVLNVLAVDSFLLQMEINKKRDDLIRKILCKDLRYTNKQAELFLSRKKSFSELGNLNEFVNRLEADLDSFYICEKVESIHAENLSTEITDDLVKLNKLDALASFKCVQKYKTEIAGILHEPNMPKSNLMEGFKIFYLIDNGNHYKCILPLEDLEEQESVESIADKSIVIENIQKRQNYIFSKDLMSVFNEEKSLTEESHRQLEDLSRKDDDLPSFSESISVNEKRKLTESKRSLNSKLNEEVIIEEELEKMSNFNKFIENNTVPKSILKDTTDSKSKNSLKEKNKKKSSNIEHIGLNLEPQSIKLDFQMDTLAQVNAKKQRNQIISNEVYKMFSTIRDHQSASLKAKGEMNIKKKKRKSGTWGYSSNKRHVIAKVMELPFVEDISHLATRVGISELKDLENCMFNREESGEKVFVRIDDFLNKKNSQVIQRSYSMDYLNKNGGPRCRVKYVKIPGQTVKPQCVTVGYEDYDTSVPQSTEYRTAPYDLRYWSILKLLEEERQAEAGQQLFGYYDENYFKADNWDKTNHILKEVLVNPARTIEKTSDINQELEKFLSKQDVEKEIEKVKKEKKLFANSSNNSTLKIKNERTSQNEYGKNLTSTPKPTGTYIIKEKTTTVQNTTQTIKSNSNGYNNLNQNVILNKIDAELEKIEKATRVQNKPSSIIDGQSLYIIDNIINNIDVFKNCSSKDVVYYDYSKSDVVTLKPQNFNNVEFDAVKAKKEINNLKKSSNLSNKQLYPQQVAPSATQQQRHSRSLSHSPYYHLNGRDNSLANCKMNNSSSHNIDYLGNQQNVFRIVDFNDQLLNSNQMETYVLTQKLDKPRVNSATLQPQHSSPKKISNQGFMKSNPNLSMPQQSGSNMQNFTLPTNTIKFFETEKSKRKN